MVGQGAFNQSNGANLVSDKLYLGYYSGSHGTYNLQGGSLSAATVNLNAGGTFSRTGGTLNATTFNQQGGTSTVNGNIYNQTGGSFYIYAPTTINGDVTNSGFFKIHDDLMMQNGTFSAPTTVTRLPRPQKP